MPRVTCAKVIYARKCCVIKVSFRCLHQFLFIYFSVTISSLLLLAIVSYGRTRWLPNRKGSSSRHQFPGSRFIGRFQMIHQENLYDGYLSAVGNFFICSQFSETKIKEFVFPKGVRGFRKALCRTLSFIWDVDYDFSTDKWTFYGRFGPITMFYHTFQMGEENLIAQYDGRKRVKV